MKSFEQKLLGRLYCFCGGGDDGGNSGSEDEAAAEQEAYDMGGGGGGSSMDSMDDDPDTGDFGVDTGSGGDDDDGPTGTTTPVDLGPTITGETTYIDEEAISEVQDIINEVIGGEGTSEYDSVYAPEYWHYGVIESSDLPGSNVGISLGDLMDEYGIPADKITYGPTDIPVIDLGMTTEEIDAIYGGDDQPEKPTTQQQIIDFVTEKAIKTLDANGDGKVSALEALGAIAVGTSGGALGILSNVNTLANELNITDKNIINEIISAIEDSIESVIGFAIPEAGAADLSDTLLANEVAAYQAGLISADQLEAKAKELGYNYTGGLATVELIFGDGESSTGKVPAILPSDPLEDILAFFDKTPSGEVTSTGGSPVTTTGGDPITTGVATSGGGDGEPGATGADDASGSPVGTTGPGTDAGITDTTGSGASPTTGPDGVDLMPDFGNRPVGGLTPEAIAAILDPVYNPDATPVSIDEMPFDTFPMFPADIPGGPFGAFPDPVGPTGPGAIDTIAGAIDTIGSGASPTTGTDTTAGTDTTTGTDTSMDTYIPYYTADGAVDVFVGTPGEFADLAAANNWTAITSMGTDSTVGVGGAGGTGGEASATGGAGGEATAAGGAGGEATAAGGEATATGGSVGDVAGGSVGDVAGGAGGAGGEATVGDVEATIGDVTGGTATVGDVAGGTATVGDVAGGAGGAATITGTVGGAGGTGGSSTVEIGPTTIDINLLPPEIADLIVDYYSDDDADAVAPVEYTPAAYTFGEPTTFTPTQDLTYREPAITSPFDFARDFGYYTLSPEIADSYATKELQSYMPTYLQPIGEMTPEEIEASRGIRSIIGPRYPVQTQPIGYPFTTTPEEEAEALLPKG
jgi:hypothetical protein